MQDLEKYRIPCYNSVEEYQTLVGETITYAPISNSRNAKMVALFGQKVKEFKILEIKKKWGKKTIGRTDWKIQNIETGEIVSLVVYFGQRKALQEKDDIGDWEDEVRNYDMPFFLMMDEFKKQYIGKEFKHPLVKSIYKVVDANIALNMKREACVMVTVVNSLDSRKYTYDIETASKDCFKSDLDGHYVTSLLKVEKPENPEIKYGEILIVEDSLTKYSYEDNYIRITIFGSSEKFSFILKNNTQHSLKLVWDDGIFVDMSGYTSKVMHTGIKYSDRELSQPSSTIIRGASLEDVAVPTRNVYYDEILKDWYIQSMYPDEISYETYNVQLMLPIQIKDVSNEYLFVFEVKYKFSHPERLNLKQTEVKI